MSEVRQADLSSLRINREPETPKRSTSRKGIILTTVAVIVAIAAWYFLRSFSFSSVEVEVATATLISPSQSSSVLTASGYVVAQRKAAVSSKISGRLTSLNVIEGDNLSSGHVIGRIESADMEASLEQYKAALDVARADVEHAQAELDDASLDAKRKEKLFSQSAVSSYDFDNAKARLNKANASLSGRRAAVKVAEANVRNAQVMLDNTVIRAPFAGTVLTKNANVGEVITALGAAAGARGAVVTLADMSSLEVEADVSESNIEKIIPDQKCEITLDAYPDIHYAGVVGKIIPTADRAKATVLVKVRFDELDSKVLPEMSAKVLFLKRDVAQTEKNAPSKLMIPRATVTERNGNPVVYVFSENAVREVKLQTGNENGGLIEVLSGVSAGEKLVLNPTEKLSDGMKVTMKK